MKAFVYDKRAPDGLSLKETEKPVPAAGEVLIRVRAASVNPIDYHFLRHPVIRRVMSKALKSKALSPGVDGAGVVEAVGSGGTHFKPGDEVFGACEGAFAEYAIGEVSKLATKPAGISFQHAASVPIAGVTALQGLRDAGQVKTGQKVLINGASGGVGTFTVQIAKHLGADVTAVCGTGNIEMVRSLGADRVIDYTREDLTKSGDEYDVFFDLVADLSFSERRRLLKPTGIYIGAGLLGKELSVVSILSGQIGELVQARFASQKFMSIIAKINEEDLAAVADLIESGKVTPVIESTYDLTDVPDAIRHVEGRHARGKVIITVAT